MQVVQAINGEQHKNAKIKASAFDWFEKHCNKTAKLSFFL